MKDRKLEEKFNEYFEGVNPPENLVAEAKKQVTANQPRRSGRILKYCSIAASVVLCCAVTIIGLAKSGIFGFTKDEFDPSLPPNVSDGDNSEIYYETSLTGESVNPYTVSKIDSSLKFLENLALYGNSYVSASSYTFEDGEKAHVKAEVTYIDGARYDAELYVEFTALNFSPVNAYKNGASGYYKGHEYFLTTETADNGEPVNKLYFENEGIKYYLYVTSSDSEAYLKFLYLIFG